MHAFGYLWSIAGHHGVISHVPIVALSTAITLEELAGNGVVNTAMVTFQSRHGLCLKIVN